MPSDDRTPSLFGSPQPLTLARQAEEVSDALLLNRFVEQWDQAAFRDLVRRHGPMVLGVCRRVLRDTHAAEDASQATFLLLIRKAGSVRKRESVGPWLYGVAQRVALAARGVASRQQSPASLDPEVAGAEDNDGLERDELHAALHEELGRLPEKYRAPLVLCYIEGLPHGAVAQQLGWPIGTVRVRIARGRDLLGARLIRRGLTPAAVLLALNLLPETARAVPVRLIEATVRAAARVAAGEGVPRGEVRPRVAELEEKVRKAMRLTRLKWAAAFALTVVVTGAVVVAAVPRAIAADNTDKAKAELKKLQGTWANVSFETQGKKNEEAVDMAVRLTFDGERYTLMMGDKLMGKGLFKLDPSKDPMELDMQFQEGHDEGKTALAIYAWDGENLKICGSKPDDGKRPTDFSTTPGDDHALVVFQRQKP